MVIFIASWQVASETSPQSETFHALTRKRVILTRFRRRIGHNVGRRTHTRRWRRYQATWFRLKKNMPTVRIPNQAQFAKYKSDIIDTLRLPFEVTGVLATSDSSHSSSLFLTSSWSCSCCGSSWSDSSSEMSGPMLLELLETADTWCERKSLLTHRNNMHTYDGVPLNWTQQTH